jgi:hypothetical protein
MPYTAAEGREQVLDALAEATDAIGLALAELGEAYELLDEQTAATLEQELFRPLQLAYGRAKRTHSAFADRHGLDPRTFGTVVPGAPSRGVKGFIDSGVQAAVKADELIATLQDSMLPIDVGDAELRAGLEDVRKLLGGVPTRARELVRTIGR